MGSTSGQALRKRRRARDIQSQPVSFSASCKDVVVLLDAMRAVDSSLPRFDAVVSRRTMLVGLGVIMPACSGRGVSAPLGSPSPTPSSTPTATVQPVCVEDLDDT